MSEELIRKSDAVGIVNGCREAGETDLRCVRDRIQGLPSAMPPNSIVTTEERVRELAKVLVDTVDAVGFRYDGNLGAAIDQLVSALRAGAKS